MEEDYFDDPEFQKLIRDYLDYLLELLMSLKFNIANENYEKLRQFGHDLTGSGGGYGFDDLTELGRKINLAAKTEHRRRLDDLVQQLGESVAEKRSEHFY